MHEYITPGNNKLKQGSLLEAHMRKPIKTWAPFDGMIYDKETKTYSNPPQRAKIDKSLWYGGVETFITKKVNEKVNTAKEARKERSRQTKERKIGDVIKHRFVQTFDKLKKVQAGDPEGIGIDTAEAVLEAYPSAWMSTSAEIEAEIQEMPGKDDEEKMENYMEARQEEILQADKIEGGLENASHPVYELMSQMKLPGTTLHARLSTLSDPDRVDLNVIQKAPEIVKRVEKIQESRAFKQWDRFTDALHSARELFNLPEEASTDELFSSDTKELLAAATDEEKEIFRKGVEAYNFIYRHLTPKAKPEKDEKGNIIDYGDTHIPLFNLGRVSVTHPDGKEGFTNVEYKIGAFGPQFKTVPKLDEDGNETGKTEQKREPDSFTSVDDIFFISVKP